MMIEEGDLRAIDRACRLAAEIERADHAPPGNMRPGSDDEPVIGCAAAQGAIAAERAGEHAVEPAADMQHRYGSGCGAAGQGSGGSEAVPVGRPRVMGYPAAGIRPSHP